MALTQVQYGILTPDVQQDIGISFKNRIINGAMRIDQRNAGAAVTNANSYIVDRILSEVYGAATGRWTAQQVTDAPSGFTNSFRITVTTADASPGANFAYAFAEQRIEGNNVADLNFGTASASPITLSFWVKSSITGTFSVVFSSLEGRVYAAQYSIVAANTWEYKTITVPGDTTGTWLKSNGQGLSVRFGHGGSSVSIAPNSWGNAAVGILGATGNTNLMATNGATWQITGLQVEKGTTATAFDYRSHGTELALCQRYYLSTLQESFPAHLHTLGTGNYVTHGIYSFPVEMRSNPTVALFAYHLDSGGSNVGDGRNGMKRYIAGGTINYFTHTFGYGVRSTRKGIVAVNMGENTTNNEHYAAGFTATSEL
jgi:hypothetical protein